MGDMKQQSNSHLFTICLSISIIVFGTWYIFLRDVVGLWSVGAVILILATLLFIDGYQDAS